MTPSENVADCGELAVKKSARIGEPWERPKFDAAGAVLAA
jgi:hypothetical protein